MAATGRQTTVDQPGFAPDSRLSLRESRGKSRKVALLSRSERRLWRSERRLWRSV